ncbi:tripartite tricarboxylate transporter permease [Burkholderia multivorans]|uniref:tripartite tricarboxylate transporter permease n=1 Tax=Burkholderia multivorans TaxID=87883 RepID=UPI0020190B7B|nr:tripartite tricarboxylate transporter permease [Burkholderia multivorans]MCL4644313.1 tripartite tricarboxylate transporter permease [Burkholderia multivorans]UQN85133.1 tripartite tricarboxylate transporter permease [Burkholderia multivorans]UQO70337.1 tripartite tricarboxylate transporter permease [Burkholderia multivorans]UQP25807.1 tripartite tricarboxylate transporter permease [Burkholderia multivorans]UQP37296.1 tripartite tricarboxylate transporter permease [Burkholderia multivorans]
MEFFNEATLMAAGHALTTLLQFNRLIFLVLGVVVGLSIGLLPGIGGLTGFALLVPFTYTMDPYAAFAMLLGMASVITTSDVIPAVLFGVPGHAASQATVLDGLPMTKRGEAARALSACYTSSLLGGLIGALILAISLPLVRPFVLSIGTPEMLALTIFGVSMVSALSGNAPLRGVVAACFGILVGMIGTNVATGQMRWTGNILYLQDGIPLVPIILGVFALPELCELAIRRTAIAQNVQFSSRSGMRQGVVDGFRNWFLIVRCGGLGAVLGAVPGITGAVTDWIAYGHALQTSKGARETFSTGDVRGVIAPEAANNAREGGSLVPMLSFGVPGGAAQAILLGAMMVHGFIPGPDMLTKHLDFTYSMVWSIALANIFGAGLCFLLSGQFAKVSTLRYTLILPIIMPIIYVGAFQGSRSWGDLFVLLIAGVLGWTMKRLRWARPPLILGLVLGVLMERYMSISYVRYGASWLTHPVVMVLLTLAALVFFKPLFTALRSGAHARLRPGARIVAKPEDLMYVFFIGVGAYVVASAQGWVLMARIGPTVIASILVIAATLSLLYKIFVIPAHAGAAGVGGGIHMDVPSDHADKLSPGTELLRAAKFLGWFVLFLLCMSVIGLVPTVPVIIVAFMRVEGREPWRLSLIVAACVTALIYGVFEKIIHIPWPSSLL